MNVAAASSERSNSNYRDILECNFDSQDGLCHFKLNSEVISIQAVDEGEAWKQIANLLAKRLATSTPPQLRISDLVEQRLKAAARLLTPTTFEKTQSILLDFYNRYGEVSVADFSPRHVQNWLDSHSSWGPSSRCLALNILRVVFSHALELRLIEASPISGFRFKESIIARVTYFDEESERLLYEHATSRQLREFIWILIQTGMRPFSEAARFTADHVEENEKGQMRIAFGRKHKTGKKTGRRRFVYVPTEAATRIRELMVVRPKGSGLPLIATSQGKAWKQKNASLQFNRLARKIELNERLRAKFGDEFSDAVLYSCRHTFATRMIPKVGLARTAALMGNTVKICERNYGHLECLHEAMFDSVS